MIKRLITKVKKAANWYNVFTYAGILVITVVIWMFIFSLF